MASDPSTGIGKRLKAASDAGCRELLEADLAAGPDLYSWLPFGDHFRAGNAEATREEWRNDQNSPGLWWLF